MIYVTSDLHGYPHEKFLSFLKESGFTEKDWLFILGDVIDRNGDGGVETLRWLLAQPNVELLFGNHEQMLLLCRFLFEEITDESLETLDEKQLDSLTHWLRNGASVTMDSLQKLCHENREDADAILEMLEEAPLYDTVSVNGRDFLLVHTAPGNFDPKKPLDEYTEHDMVWNRPTMDTRLYDDAMTIFGHTPVSYLGATEWRMLKTDTWCCIDTGGAGGGAPMLLRLDDMKEFYPEEIRGEGAVIKKG